MALIPCICVSTAYICITLWLAEASRNTLKTFLNDHPLLQTGLLEAIATAELCGVGFELVIIADNYGVLCYGIYLFFLTIWWSSAWSVEKVCPYLHFEDCLLGRKSWMEAGVCTLAETVGGLLVFQYIYFLWWLEITETHVGRAHSATFNNCPSDLHVSTLGGVFVEGIATMLCRISSKFLADQQPQYSTAIDSFIATFLVVASFNYSGGYLNPVLATSLKYGCKGHPLLEHVLVYWIGASLGAIASIFVYPMLSQRFEELKTKEE
uniref:Aquaporin n=1 Tax=Caligus clemensi TaxID=344056 RepID=C1C114_CALCM|nr:Aquaporin-12A [Caligus clemensi]